MTVDQAIYIFRGRPYLQYIDDLKFKKDISSIFEVPDDTWKLPFPEYFTNIISEYPDRTEDVRKTFFENILYTHLKNIFVDKIKGNPDLEVKKFKDNVKKLIQKVNHKESIPLNHHQAMSEDGFYLMDVLNVTSSNTSFIAGYDYESENDMVSKARFLYVEVVPTRDLKDTYFISGIDIDFQEGIALTMIKNVEGLSKGEGNANTTIHQLRHSTMNRILNKLGISLEKPNVINDRESMFEFCKELDDKLLRDIRDTLNSKAKLAVEDSVKNLSSAIFSDTEEKLTIHDKRDLSKQILALLLGYYIKQYGSNDLVRKAKEIKLVGYPTRVKFTSSKQGKSSTQTNNAKQPVSGSDMFHSLYFNFEQALGLDSWSISWFTDYLYTDDKDTDVIGTTIYARSTSFRVVFRPTRALDKEMIYYVIREINSRRK